MRIELPHLYYQVVGLWDVPLPPSSVELVPPVINLATEAMGILTCVCDSSGLAGC